LLFTEKEIFLIKKDASLQLVFAQPLGDLATFYGTETKVHYLFRKDPNPTPAECPMNLVHVVTYYCLRTNNKPVTFSPYYFGVMTQYSCF